MADTVDTVVNELIINKLTQAQFDAIPEAERSDTELYFITDAKDNSLPDQTGNAGKFLTTDGTTASWGDAVVNNAQDSYSFAVGPSSSARGASATAVGIIARAWAAGATQLGNGTNVDANTFKVANNKGNFEMMDVNGNVPLERLTYVTNQIGDISTALTAILGE